MSVASFADVLLPISAKRDLKVGVPRSLLPARLLGMLLARLALGLLFPLLVLAIWHAAAVNAWLPPQLLPAPALVWSSLVDLLQTGELLRNLWISLMRVAWSLLLGGSIGAVLGFSMALSPTAKAYLYPSFEVFAQFPVIGWAPLLIIFLGIDEGLKIAAITITVIVPFTLSIYQGIRNVPRACIEVAGVYRFSFLQKVFKVALPAALPSIVNGVRQSVMQAWLALVFVELLVSSEGIGYLMVYARNLMQLDVVVVCMIAVGAVGTGLDILLSIFEWHVQRRYPRGF